MKNAVGRHFDPAPDLPWGEIRSAFEVGRPLIFGFGVPLAVAEWPIGSLGSSGARASDSEYIPEVDYSLFNCVWGGGSRFIREMLFWSSSKSNWFFFLFFCWVVVEIQLKWFFWQVNRENRTLKDVENGKRGNRLQEKNQRSKWEFRSKISKKNQRIRSRGKPMPWAAYRPLIPFRVAPTTSTTTTTTTTKTTATTAGVKMANPIRGL